ncbi:MAG: hypothetical protein O9341_22605, partial [Paucibacter sp.]|nr:hypothetical protein [Roseateles sp.]
GHAVDRESSRSPSISGLGLGCPAWLEVLGHGEAASACHHRQGLSGPVLALRLNEQSALLARLVFFVCFSTSWFCVFCESGQKAPVAQKTMG